MTRIFTLLLICLSATLLGQLKYSAIELDLGIIDEAYEIKAELIISNTGEKTHYLLKADSERDLKIFTSKKSIKPNDTALLVFSFIPGKNGSFKKDVSLFTSSSVNAEKFVIKGNLRHFKSDDKQACYYFGKPKFNKTPQDNPVIVKNTPEKRDNSNKLPDNTQPPLYTATMQPQQPEPLKKAYTTLPEAEYKPNHILFLIDVSNSMKDSLKLPLMKNALHSLINDLRDVDRVTFVTYSDSIRVLKENISGSEKDLLHSLTDQIKAKGLTKGRQAILKSEDILLKHYITEGNNQMILATDGKFNFYSDDRKLFISKQNEKPIVLSTLAFGNDREALKNLKDIAEAGNGSMIHIRKKTDAYHQILEEIKLRSKMPNTKK